MNIFDVFKSTDEAYLSPDAAEVALRCEFPGGKPPRSDDVARDMTSAARRGLFDHYRKTINAEWDEYEQRLESTVERLGPPKFSDPPIGFGAELADAVADAKSMMAHAKAHYEQVMVVARARHVVVAQFGGVAVDAALAPPREREKVAMVMEMLRAAFDGRVREMAGYDDPQAVELALVAVIIGLDLPMRSLGDPDAGDLRRARWQGTLGTAKRQLSSELTPQPPRVRGR